MREDKMILSITTYGDALEKVEKMFVPEHIKSLFDDLVQSTDINFIREFSFYSIKRYKQFIDFMKILSKENIPYQTKMCIFQNLDYMNNVLKYSEDHTIELSSINLSIYKILKYITKNFLSNIVTDFDMSADDKCNNIITLKKIFDDIQPIEYQLYFGKNIYQDYLNCVRTLQYILQEECEVSLQVIKEICSNVYTFFKICNKTFNIFKDEMHYDFEEKIKELKDCIIRLKILEKKATEYYKNIGEIDIFSEECVQPKILIDLYPTKNQEGDNTYTYSIISMIDDNHTVFTNVFGSSASVIEAREDLFNNIYDKWLNNVKIKPMK